MKIKGLENNYYLAGNDIWIRIDSFSKPTSTLTVVVKSIDSGKTLAPFVLSPTPIGDYYINISLIVRALMPYPEHNSNPLNTMGNFEITFIAGYRDGTRSSSSLTKYFIRGGRDKENTKEWFLRDGDRLVVNKWVEWSKVELPGLPVRIQGGEIRNYTPIEKVKLYVPEICNYRIVKFLNSLGGYQYWLFENHQTTIKTNPLKRIRTRLERLRYEGVKTTGMKVERSIELYTKTPSHLQSIITDLACSNDVYLYDPKGNDRDSKWQRLLPESNTMIENTFDGSFNNKLTFSFPTYVNKKL